MQAEMNDRTLAFLLNDRLNFSMYDLCRFIEDRYKSVDICTIKKNFIEISGDISDNIINDILSSFIIDQVKEIDSSIDNLDLIKNNTDVFFDITEDSSNMSITIERSTYN